MTEVIDALIRLNVVGSAALILVLLFRAPVARAFGGRAAYGLWLAVPLALLASLLPPRRVSVPIDRANGLAISEPAAGPLQVPTLQAVSTPIDLEPVLLALWAIGALGAMAALAWRQQRFVHALGHLRPEGGVFRSEAVGVGPALVGLLRPRIIVPADFEARYSELQRTAVLAHETTHLRRGDHLVNALVALVQCLAWFNPLVHLAAARLRQDQELACDALVIAARPQARRAYAEAMLKTQLGGPALPLGCQWPPKAAHPLRQRVLLLSDPPGLARRAAGALVAAGLSLGVGLAAWAAQPPRTVHLVAAAPSVADGRGRALIEVASAGDLAGARALAGAGADVNHYEPGDGTPLLVAARSGQLAMARYLVEQGADVNAQAPGDGNALIAAAKAGEVDIAALLLARGAKVNAVVPGDETPLINASAAGKLAMVRFLVERGADVNQVVQVQEPPGWRSPLSMARSPLVQAYLRSRGARR